MSVTNSRFVGNSKVPDTRPNPALVLVATPIGNLGDISARALSELSEADAIACEDTRRTGQLLSHFGLAHGRLIVCNQHTEMAAAQAIVERIGRGERVVLVSDAGMPGISDPGERVVREVLAAGYEVTAVPGASAVLMALAVSGLDASRFVFEGFLPRKGRERVSRIQALLREERTVVLFEAPRRVAATVASLADVLGDDRRIVVARELTKRFEEVWRGTLADAVLELDSGDARGEYVIVLAGAAPTEVDDAALIDAIRSHRAAGSTNRDAAAQVAAQFEVGKRRVYDIAIALDRSATADDPDDGSAGG